MYIDDYGKEFKTIEEAKKFYAKQFYEEMEENPCDIARTRPRDASRRRPPSKKIKK